MDNKGANSLSKTYENSQRNEHIGIRTHFIKDLVKNKVIDVYYISSYHQNISDILYIIIIFVSIFSVYIVVFRAICT